MRKFIDWTDKALLAVTSSMLIFIVLLTLVQVFFRYVLNNALSWSEELTRIAFIWMTFITGAVAINQRRHLRIDTFINLLPERGRLIIDLAVHALILLFFLFLLFHAFNLAARTINTMTGALRWPRSVFFLPVAIGGCFFVLFSLRIVSEDILRIKKIF